MISEETLKRTPLYEEHVALKARMVPFGGWELPVQYEGILCEYEHTRAAVTLFDTSHMGEFVIEGDSRHSGLDRIVTMAIADMPLKSCRYGMALNDVGGVIDDLIVFREEPRKWFIVVNAATAANDAAHFRKNLKRGTIFKDISALTGKIDVQGPASRGVLKTLVADIERLEYYAFNYFDLLGERVLISRTGYTGELGYEIYFPWDKTAALWRALLKCNDVKPAGLGARDLLRLEVGYSLYGHELGEDITSLEAGLKKFVDFEKDFIGKEALLRQQREGLRRKIVGFTSGTRRSPRHGQALYLPSGERIGVVTSGTFSPACQRGIGLGFVESAYAQRETKILFGDDKNKNDAIITDKIFYKKGSLKA